MKLGLKLWSVNTDAYLREAVKLYARKVFDYLEIYFVPGSEATAAEWRATEIPCIVHAPHSRHGVNLAAADHESYNRETFAAVRKFADALSAPDIIAHGGALGSIAEIVRQLKLIGDPRILIENKPYLPIDRSEIKLAGSTPEEVAEVIAGASCGFCLDIGHMVASANAHKTDWRDYFTSFLSLKPKMFHLSDLEADSDIDQHLHFGDGSLPLGEIMSRLPSDARISIETKRDSADNLDDFARDAASLGTLDGQRTGLMLKRSTLVKHGREKRDADSERTPRGAMSEDLNAAPFQESAPLSERSVAYSVGAGNSTCPKTDVLVRLRRAEPRDMRRVFELSNDPLVRANSIHSESIAWETHVAWFNRAISDPDVVFFVAETETGEFAGQIRFNRRGGDWLVSISIDSAYRGRGLTKALLIDAMSHISPATFVAEIAASNAASMRLFTSVGFSEDRTVISPSGFKTFKMTANA